MRTIAVGDIHGCRASLEDLAEFVEFSRDDTIVTLGDYVDRGPDTKGAIDFLLKLRKKTKLIPLLGNHEAMMLEARQSREALFHWLDEGVGGADTLDSYGARSFNDIPAAHWRFIERAELYYETDTHFFVHAGAVPDIALENQPPLTLLWERFDNPPPHQNGKIMICGHTSQRSGLPANLGHAICIDTWACGDGWLTALDVDSGCCWQSNERGERRIGEIEEFLAA